MKYLCLIIFFFANYLYAQQKFEVYVVNDNYYIVDLETETAASDFFEVEKIVLENYTIIEDVPKVRDEVFVKEVLFKKNQNR